MVKSSNRPRRGLVGFLLGEPLFHFLAIAILLFVANSLFAGDAREVIEVDTATRDYLVQAQEDLLLRPLSAAEKQGVVDVYIEEEILVREARRRGFDNSSRIRALLIQNMRFFLSQDLPAPSDDDVRRHFERHPERFEQPPSTSYDQVFFSDPEAIPEGVLEALNEGADPRQYGSGDRLAGWRLSEVTALAIAQSFGPDVAPQVIAIDDKRWHGPFDSAEGAHFLRVAERHPGLAPEFDAIRSWVSQDWQLFTSRQRIEEALEEMQTAYDVRFVDTLEDAE